MSPEEFCSLPPAIALKLLLGALDERTRERALLGNKPKTPFPPKYDLAIFRREGLMWASETDLEGLRFWHGKASASADTDGPYAAKDAKRRDSLARWIAWREVFPESVWSGERENAPVTAKMPSGKPTIYPRTRGGSRGAPPPPPDYTPDADPIPDDEVPF